MRVVFFIPPDVTALDLVGPLQVFQMAAIHSGEAYEFVMCGLNRSEPVAGNLQFGNLRSYRRVALARDDILVVAGFQGATEPAVRAMRRHPAFFEWIRRASRDGATVCSTCTGAFFLAEAGVLDGKPCVTHWADNADLQRQYPRTQVRSGILFAEAGHVFTSAGVAAGIDLAIHLVAQRHGSRLAFEVARRLVIYLRRHGESEQDSIYLRYRNHLDDVVHRAQTLLIEHLDAPPGIELLAARVGSSPRNLSRRFQRSLGLSIGAYLRELRLERARALLREDGSKVEDVARACGFSDGRQLRNLYRGHFGHSPRARLPA
ncbi:helix-turn-helix domain-containing protein [Oleiharenicola lentus]|uniref:Helix-turn-helix domain-containing protein n=1 Tax=Oleiharenicola lentus TaxID=2508720 RepID=A0A4Q1C7S6_9BACT|nr:helix-turn-helix domain-containing protein [Oleiharenicola lentus]RXK54977.1 helix-turn-helix domain-containing protein [Oleiharenicola lentus]